MSKEVENKNSYKVLEDSNIGEVRIADEVIAIIAGLAATEVDGVNSMAGNVTNELVGKLGMKNLSKGVKVLVDSKAVAVDLTLNMEYGYSIPKTSGVVQEKVKQAIENMTGLPVSEVNIRITGVKLEGQK
ncbi:MAG: Asp23/Gls24 family envelope stress response protein [Acetivibrio sp.]